MILRTDDFMNMLGAVLALGCVALIAGCQRKTGTVAVDRHDRPPTAVARPVRTSPGPMIHTSNSLGFKLQKGQEDGLQIDRTLRSWSIRDGEARFPGNLGRILITLDPKISIDRFEVPDDQVMVRLNMSPIERSDEFMNAVDGADHNRPPLLSARDGNTYCAVGLVSLDSQWTRVRYTRDRPLDRLSEALPADWRSRPMSILLLFLVPRGAEICELRVGDIVVEVYEPSMRCDRQTP